MRVKKRGEIFMKSKKIPEFKTIEEEAKFWDTHDVTDNWEGDKLVKVKFAKNLHHILGVRLDPQTITELEEQGKKKGIGPSTLARMWILEKLHQSA